MVDCTSIWGIPIAQPPADLFSAAPHPDNDPAEGLILGVDTKLGMLNFLRPNLGSGPAALTAHMALLPRQDTFLWSDVSFDPVPGFPQGGFRGGMVEYQSPGTGDFNGRVFVAGPAGVKYHVTVWQAHDPSPDPRRAGFVTENRQKIGGGWGTYPGADYLPFAIDFYAEGIQYIGSRGTCCELSVSVYAETNATTCAALGYITSDPLTGQGGVIPGYATRGRYLRTAPVPPQYR